MAADQLTPALEQLFHSHLHAADVSVAELWARRIHWAFYSSPSTRGSNKFFALESTLTKVFTTLSTEATGQLFWDFAVSVVLVLAREPTFSELHTGTTQSTTSSKPKKWQPNAPLAFLMVNALRKLSCEGGEQKEFCLFQGRNNEQLRTFCSSGLGDHTDIDQKLVVELMRLFQITDVDAELVRKTMEHLVSSKSHAALIKLCETFPDVDWPFESIVATMVQTKDWTSAELLVRMFEGDGNSALAKILIDETVHLREFKRAHRLVLNFNLQQQYPDIDVLYSRDGLMRLIETQRWQLALTFVGHDATLQKMLLEHMVAARQLEHATPLVDKMTATGFESDVSQIIKGAGETESFDQSILEDGDYLMLPVDTTVVFCGSESSLRQAVDYFFDSETEVSQLYPKTAFTFNDTLRVVGLDVEWKPVTSRSKTATAVASILQIATSDQVFVIDLLALHDSNFLFDNFLLHLLTSPQWLKVGFSFESDLKVLQQTFPERQAFATVSPFLDLNELLLKSGAPAGSSLSQSVLRILGKPLDKRMQLSNWEERPLSAQQLYYAALDAQCLVQVISKLQRLPSDSYRSSWSEVCQNIGSRAHSSSLTKAQVLEAVSLRCKYQKTWRVECTADREPKRVTPLVTAQDIERMWNERTFATAHELDENSDTSLKLLPVHEITALLESTADAPNFVAVNSICVFIDDTPSVVCIDASCKLDMAQLARLCDVGRRKVRLATSTECHDVFGFTPGTVAPFGHKAWKSPNAANGPQQIVVYADSRLQNVQYLAAGSGSKDRVIWVESNVFFTLISIKLIDNISTPRDSSRTPLLPSSTPPTTFVGTDKEPNLLEYKFLADSMVTQVGRWLRTIGVDVVTWNPGHVKDRIKDPKSMMLAYAAKQNRIVLTRDTSLPSRRDAGACFVLSGDECYKQFREVKLQFGLLEHMGTRSSRCARCNSDTFSPIDATSARKKMSERLRKKVPASVTKFGTCNGCGRIYWEGPKYTPSMNLDEEPSPDSRVIYRPVPRTRIAGDRNDQRHLREHLP